MGLKGLLVFNREQHDRRRRNRNDRDEVKRGTRNNHDEVKGGTRNNRDEVKGGTRMKTEGRASFLDRGETNMVSHRPRKRTWTNQKKGDQRRKNLGEKDQ